MQEHDAVVQRQDGDLVDDTDPSINRIRCQMKTIMDDFKLSEQVVADLYCRLSGDLTNIRKHCMGKPVPFWTYLEDLALEKPEESEEYQVLLRTKGQKEIDARKAFLMFGDEVKE